VGVPSERLEASGSGFDVTDATTGTSEKKFYTFKTGANKFVPAPAKSYARTTLKHDPSKNRTNEKALTTNGPQCQPDNSQEDHAAMDSTPAANNDNTIGHNNTLTLNFINNTTGDQTEEASMEVVIGTPLSPDSQLLENLESTLNQKDNFDFGLFGEDGKLPLFHEETYPELCFTQDDHQDGFSNNQDEGYSTAGSTSGKSSPTGSFGEDQSSDGMEILQLENTVEAPLQDLNTDASNMFGNINNTNLLVLTAPEPHFQTQEDCGNNQPQTLDHGPIMQETSNTQYVYLDVVDTTAPELTLVGTYNNYPEMIQANPSLAAEKVPKGPRRHTKGPKQAELDEIPEQNRKNVMRCRKYRENKKVKVATWEDELETLQTRNTELREEEKMMKAKLAKVQESYINLIKTGRIKCA